MSLKKYFWLRLKEDFFHDPKIKKLRRMAGGDTYTIILQKIMLLSIKDGGVIEYQGIEKTLHEELALILDEDVINVEAALSFMRAAGFIESIEGNRFLLPLVPQLVGSETDSAERVRKLRERRKSEPPALQCNGDVTPCNENVTTDIEKEKELEKDWGENARDEYLRFRLAGEGIINPIAVRKTILSDLTDPTTTESNNYVEWTSLINNWPEPLSGLYRDFCSFGQNDRKKCKEIATDYFNNFGVNITSIMFEIAYQESRSFLYKKRVESVR